MVRITVLYDAFGKMPGMQKDWGLSVGKPVLLSPVATDEFEIAGPREDRLHVDRDATGAIVGITLNPGPWAVHATRR